MKMKIGLLMICLLLCGCKVDNSPEMQFDHALSEVEEMDDMRTTWTLLDPHGEIMTKVETKTSHIQTQPVVDMKINGEGTTITGNEPLAQIGRFRLLGNSFLNFSRQENPYGDIIAFDVSQTDYHDLAGALDQWITIPFQKVSGTMHLDEYDALEFINYQIETDQGIYQFELALEDKP